MSKLIVCLGRFGDLCNIFPLARHDFVSTGDRWQIMVCKEFAGLFDGISYAGPVIFDGPMFALDAAMKQAREMNSEAVTCQLVGPEEIVKQAVITRNGVEYRATTESFQKDAWNLLGRLGEWKNQHPLVFDKRDSARENELCARVLPKNRKKTILVSHSGISSPFPYGETLLELLRLKFKAFNVIDISEIKAERFYDLLGLYEKAHCLVATDSAPLHLACALPELPVVALTQDRPSFWHGSCWRPQHIFYCRYHDFPVRAPQMLSRIERLGSEIPAGGRRIVHVWSQYDLLDDPEMRIRHHKAKETWPASMIDTPAEVGVFGKDAKNTLLCDSNNNAPIRDGKRVPFVSDVLRLGMLRAQDDDAILLTRADTCLTDLDAIEKVNGTPLFAQRTILDRDGAWAHPAVDMFCFTKKWWREHQKEWPNMLLGKDPYWWITLRDLFRKHGGKEIENAIYRFPSTREPEKSKPGDGVPARIVHNEKLARKWAEENKVAPFIKSTAEQVEHWPLNRRGLSPFGYNPSLIRHNGKLLLAYRYHHLGDPATTLAMAELDEKGNVLENNDIQINGVAGSTEDVKLFELNGELCMSLVMSTWPNNPPKSIVKWGKLTKGERWSVREHFQPKYGKNDGSVMEKNWVPFGVQGRMHFIYSSQPDHIVIELNGAEIVNEWKSKSQRWPYGPLKGGTPPIEYKGKWLRFIHGTLDNEPPPFRRRYFLTACLMEPEPPFAMISVIQKPIIKGAEPDELTAMEKSSCHHHKSNVVFPGGVVKDGNDFLVAYGVNDSACAVARIKEADLKFA